MSSVSDVVNAQVSSNELSGMSSLVTITEKLVERMNKEKASQAVDFDNNVDYRRAKSKIAKIQSFKNRISDSVSTASKADSGNGKND